MDVLSGGAGRDSFMLFAADPATSVTITDFDAASTAERIHIHRSWLAGLEDLTGDGRVNRADLANSFAVEGSDLVFQAQNGARLVLTGAATTDLTTGDFWLFG